MSIDKNLSQYLQKVLGYSDDEMKNFLENPRNQDVIPKMLAVSKKTIIAEVIESHGCYIEHKTGDKLYFDGGGNLITKLCPKRICPFLVSALTPLLFSVQELIYAGVEPNELRFNRTSCPDPGIKCGGWGHVVVQVSVTDR